MVVTEQVDALKAFAVNPVKYLVVPRFLGLIIMLPVLTMLSDVIGIWGGYVICVFKLHISHEMFWKMTFRALTMKDIIDGLDQDDFLWHDHRHRRLPSGLDRQRRCRWRGQGHNHSGGAFIYINHHDGLLHHVYLLFFTEFLRTKTNDRNTQPI